MSKKTGGVVAVLLVLCGLTFFLLNCGSNVSRSSGLLYVLSQASNDVSSYSINLNSGALSLINSNATTCTTAPCGLPVNIILDPTGANAFVLDQGVFTPPNTQTGTPASGVVSSIYGYTISSDGSLASKGDLTTGATPQSLPCDNETQGIFTACDVAVAMVRDSAGTFLFVITGGNQNLPPPLTPLAPQLYVFSIQSGSPAVSLMSQTSLTYVPTGLAAATANSNTVLYVTGNQDLTLSNNDNTLHEYSVDASGNVVELPGSPYTTASNPSSVLAVTTSPIGGSGGLFVYVTNVTTHSVSLFRVCTVQTASCTAQDVTDLTLQPVGTPASVGSNPVGMVVHPTNNFLFVVSKDQSQISGFRINAAEGTLSALSPATMSTGASPIALAMHSSGKFLFVSNNGGSSVSSFNVDTTSGALSSPNNVTSPGNPAGLVSK